MTPFCRNLSQRTLALGLGAFLGLAALAGAQPWAPPAHRPSSGVHVFPSRNVRQPILKSGVNLTYRGGPVITSAHVVFIFWGPSFNNAASPDYSYARTLQSFRNQFGTTPEYNTITQYSGSNGTIALTNLAAGTPDWFDITPPPINVTEAIAQNEVNTYLSTHAFDANAIYEVAIPTTSYSSLPVRAPRAADRPSGTAPTMASSPPVAASRSTPSSPIRAAVAARSRAGRRSRIRRSLSPMRRARP